MPAGGRLITLDLRPDHGEVAHEPGSAVPLKRPDLKHLVSMAGSRKELQRRTLKRGDLQLRQVGIKRRCTA
jgi:hypothetical protein